MPLDTQQFGITRYWLAAALNHVPAMPDVFVASKQLSQARKLFLAGKNQLAAVRNWLAGAGVIPCARAQNGRRRSQHQKSAKPRRHRRG